jgi:hypothetical protein
VLQCLALLSIVYVFCDLKGPFIQTAGTLILSSLVGAALGLAISACSSTTESAIALLPVVLLPIIALGGGIRAIYKIPQPARSLSYVVASRWALESNLISEARQRPCGYLGGSPPWDSCPAGGAGVDAAVAQFPDAVAGDGDDRFPAASSGGHSLRHTFGESMVALGSMLAVLVSSVLVFLRLRDIH